MPRVNNEPKPKKPKKVKRPTIKKSQKALITQDNRFIYAKYEVNLMELKIIYYILSKINPITDQDFKEYEIPISELIGALKHKSDTHRRIIDTINSLASRVVKDDNLVIDEATQKVSGIYTVTTFFKRIVYDANKSVMRCLVNEYLKPYLLGLEKRFTSILFEQILPIRSYYGVRIFQMLLSEIKQNRKFLRLNLLYLQDILSVPQTLYRWADFNRYVLKQAQKEINGITNLFITDIKTFKTGKKITEIEFHFRYKDKEKRQKQDESKEKNRLEKQVIKPLEELKGKSLNYTSNTQKLPIQCVYNGVNRIEEINGKLFVRIELDYLNDYAHKQKIHAILNTKEQVEKLKEMHEKYQAEFYNNPEHLKNIAERESGAKKEATTNNEVKILNKIANRSEQNKANNGATLFDKLETSNDTEIPF